MFLNILSTVTEATLKKKVTLFNINAASISSGRPQSSEIL